MNKFIIISPSFNNQDWTEVYYESIQCQTYKNYEVLYINDCSTDNTWNNITELTQGNPQFKCINNATNKGATFNYVNSFKLPYDENVIFVNLDGDDWLATPTVLENLNELYTTHDYWMTYGKLLVYDGTETLTAGNPQNTPYDTFVHAYKYYRRDVWRASHLRTFKKFLFDKIDPNDFISQLNNELFYHASDLAFMYPMLEMSPIDKIGVIQFPTYVYNASKENASRTAVRENKSNQIYEEEIRNKKTYARCSSKLDLSVRKKLPQINVCGDYRERNSIPTTFSYVYNRTFGEYDITLFQDESILKYTRGEIEIPRGKLVADIHEPPYLFKQSDVISETLKHHERFDLILTYNEELLSLPNAQFRNGSGEVVLNKNVHKQTYPILQDTTLYQIYSKQKNISFITSNKTFSSGHVFRLECLNHLLSNNSQIEYFGVGIREILGKIEGLQNYRFSIAMENGISPNYFTEKILDCFLTGTIPIYHGCPNISKFFNVDGIICFSSKDELQHIVNTVDETFYNSKLDAIRENFQIAQNFWWDNDRYFEKYLKKLL
jgi:glycosyltransferase involved in cell wall biosynthesis